MIWRQNQNIIIVTLREIKKNTNLAYLLECFDIETTQQISINLLLGIYNKRCGVCLFSFRACEKKSKVHETERELELV
jgi:hypothetical protein